MGSFPKRKPLFAEASENLIFEIALIRL